MNTPSSSPRNHKVTKDGTNKKSIIGKYILASAPVSTVEKNYMAAAPE
jgi:hypothetical protein